MSNSDVFLSYRRKDVDFVKQIDQALRADGREVWVDWEDIPPGVEGFGDEIQRGIESASAFIAILSPAYLESEYCLMELREALKLKKRIIPVVFQKFEPAPAPEGIGHINWVYFTPHAGLANTFEESFPKIIKALEADYEHAREHTRLLLRTIDWDKNQRNKSYLLKGAEIDKAESWQIKASGKNPAPTETQLEYIVTGRKQQRKQQRQFTAVIGALLILAIAAAIYAVFQAGVARRNEQRAILSEEAALKSEQAAILSAEIAHSNFLASSALQPGNEDLAVALALESTRSNNAPPETFKTLTLVSYPIRGIRYLHQPDTDETFSEYFYPAISPDGQFVVIKNRLYNLTTDTFILEFKNTPNRLLMGLFLPDGKRVILAGDDDGYLDPNADPIFMGLYDVNTGELLRKFDTGIGVFNIQLSGTGQTLIGYQPDGKAIWWNVNSGKKLREFEDAGYGFGSPAYATFSPDLKWMAAPRSVDAPGIEIVIYDTSTMEIETVLPGVFDMRDNYSTPKTFSPDSNYISIGYASGLRTYAVDTGGLWYTYNSSVSLSSIHYSPDGNSLVTIDGGNNVILWDMYTEEIIKNQVVHSNDVLFADFVKNGERIISMDVGGTVIEWDAIPGNREKILPASDVEDYVTATQDGLHIIAVRGSAKDSYISILDKKSLKEVKRIPFSRSDNPYLNEISYYLNEGLEKGMFSYSSFETSADGATTTTTINIASLDSGETLHTITIDGAATAQLSPNGKEIIVHITSNSKYLNHLEKREITSGKIIHEYITPYFGNLEYSISPHGDLLWVSSTENNADTYETVNSSSKMINTISGETLFTIESAETAYFPPTGSEVITIPTTQSDQKSTTLIIRDVVNGAVIRSLNIKTQITNLLFHPDGKSFFTSVQRGGGGGGYTLPSGINIEVVSGSSGFVTQWSYATGELIWEFQSEDATPMLTADGSFLITQDYSGTVFWRLNTPEQLVTWACANRYVPEFTAEQRERFSIDSEESICKSR